MEKEKQSKTKLDPWGSSTVRNYAKLYQEFGISPFEPLLKRIPSPPLCMRRQIIFGHRDYELILDSMERNREWAVMSGFMPSGRAHLGAKMVMEEIIWHQSRGGDAFVAIADIEAHLVRGVSWNDCKKIGVEEYILSLIALGFEPSGYIYFQSENPSVKDLAIELGSSVTASEMGSIYGFTSSIPVGHMISALIQSADILAPQLEKFGGPKPVVIPVGADQDPHLRLTRDLAFRQSTFQIEPHDDYILVRSKKGREAVKELASKFDNVKVHELHLEVEEKLEDVREKVMEVEKYLGGNPFFLPSSTYHRFMSGLRGGKMSSSVPESYIGLTDPPEEGMRKIKYAKTGGKPTAMEQKMYGGNPEECVVYELLLFHLMKDDREIEELYSECRNGRRTCGRCKEEAASLLSDFLREHERGREEAKERLREYGINHT